MVSLGASCPLPLPLTDGGAKTKQGPGLSPVRGEASPASKEQRGPRLIQPVGQRKKRPETMLVVDDESRAAGMVGKQLKRTVIKEQSLPHNGSGSPIVPVEGN